MSAFLNNINNSINERLDTIELYPNVLCKEIWDVPTQNSTRDGDIENDSPVPEGGWTDAEEALNIMYEPLRLTYPNYITREDMGLDSSGNYHIWKYIFTPEGGYEQTIILSSCLHGNEYTGYYSLWQFMKAICEVWTTEPHLNYMRNRVRIIVIPIINPWGFTFGFRQNYNSVDLNRNSGYLWDKFNSPNLDTGVATGGSLTTLVDTTKDWSGVNLTRTKVVITSGKGAGQSGYILSHTENTLTLFESTPFDESPDETSEYVILSKYYKGTSAWSEPEAIVLRDIFSEYSESTVYLDLHTIVSVSAHYIMYAPRFLNYPSYSVERVIRDKLLTNERLVWGTSTLPTMANFASFTYKMASGNPEIRNSMYGNNRDSLEMTRSLWFFGNIILQFTYKNGKADKIGIEQTSIKHYSYDGYGNGSRVYSLYSTPQTTSFLKRINEVRGFRIVNDGFNLYVLCNSNKKVYEYILDEAFNIETARFTGRELDLSLQNETFWQDLCLNNDGTKLFVTGSTNKKIIEYNMSTPFDISTITMGESINVYISPDAVIVTGMDFSIDGSKLYLTSEGNIFEMNLSTPFDITTAFYQNLFTNVLEQGSISTSTGGNSSSTSRVRTDYIPASAGITYRVTTSEDYVAFGFHYYDESYNWLGQTGNTAPVNTAYLRLAFRRNDNADFGIDEINAMDILITSNESNNQKLNISSVENSIRSIKVIENSTTRFIFVVGNQSKKVYRFTFGLSANLSDGVRSDMELDVSDRMLEEHVPRVITLSPFGTYLYFLGSVRNIVWQYRMATERDLNSVEREDNEVKWLPSSGDLQTVWSTFSEFNSDNNAIIYVSGEITVKSDRDCTIQMRPRVYQPYSPEFKSSTVTDNYSKQFKRRVRLKANEETSIQILCMMQGQPTNLGMSRKTGVVSTDGVNVSYVSGDRFDTRYWESGNTITINGVNYTISTIVSDSELTLTQDAGLQSNVIYRCQPYGNPRTQDIKFRVSLGAEGGKGARIFVKSFNYSIQTVPTELGFCLNLYKVDNIINSFNDLKMSGISFKIDYPSEDKFRIDNYIDGDGYDLTVDDEVDSDDNEEGQE